MARAKSIRGSGGAGCQRLSQAPSSKHSLPVSVLRNPPDALGKGRSPTLQHLIIFQRVFFRSNLIRYSPPKEDIDMSDSRCAFKDRSICIAINYLSWRYTCIWTGKINPLCFISKQHLSGNVFYGLSMKKRQTDQQVFDTKNAWCHAQLGLKTFWSSYVVSIATSEKNSQVLSRQVKSLHALPSGGFLQADWKASDVTECCLSLLG